ncbi:MAG TPA: ABC transporter ATP-binding protein [Holosporales bacterium]|nr:ABC transporter ATP-binding protein [Holosporales bacterium]
MSKTPSLFSAIQKIIALLSRQEKWKWASIMGFAVVASVLEVVTASVIVVFASSMTDPQSSLKYLKYLGIDGDITSGRIIFYIAISVGVIYFLKNAFAAVEVFFQNFTVQRMNYRFKNKLLHKYSEMNYAFHLTRNSSYGMSVVAGDVEQMFSGGVLSLAAILSEFMVFIFLVSVIIYMDPSLAGYLLGLSLCFSFIVYKFLLPAFYRWGQKLQDSGLLGTKKLMQFFHGFKEIILFGKKETFVEAYTTHAKTLTTIRAIHTAVNCLPRMVIEVLFVAVFVFAIAYMSLQHDQPQQMLGVMGGYLYLGFRVMPGLNRIIGQINNFKSVIPYISRVHEEFFIKSKGGKLANEPQLNFRKTLSINNLSFQYLNTDKTALKDISFEIQKGDCVGIVGETGSGKSTLVDLILGLLKPAQGEILIDNTFTVASKQWHQKIGYVPQSIYLVDDTIEANIAFGEDDIDQVRLTKAINAAQLDKLISGLDEGVKTLVGERGVRLSGGERQRIAIARALYRQPEVLIFDEATSALDTETESRLMKTINEISKNYTVIMIAHRLSTLSRCNKIIKLKNGSLADIELSKEVSHG